MCNSHKIQASDRNMCRQRKYRFPGKMKMCTAPWGGLLPFEWHASMAFRSNRASGQSEFDRYNNWIMQHLFVWRLSVFAPTPFKYLFIYLNVDTISCVWNETFKYTPLFHTVAITLVGVVVIIIIVDSGSVLHVNEANASSFRCK